MRVVTSIPAWTANEGEFVAYESGDVRRIYVYINGSWKYIGWQGSDVWVALARIRDADQDTFVDSELNADEDIIRMTTGSASAVVIDASQDVEVMAGSLAIPSGEKINLEGLTGDTYMTYNSGSDYMEIWVDGTKRVEL